MSLSVVGQMSGQAVKPKNRICQRPCSDEVLKGWPFWSISSS